MSQRKGLIMSDLKVEKFILWHKCAVCGAEPRYWYVRQGFVLVACINPEHQGFEKRKSWRELWNEGQPVPIEIAQNLEKRQAGTFNVSHQVDEVK